LNVFRGRFGKFASFESFNAACAPLVYHYFADFDSVFLDRLPEVLHERIRYVLLDVAPVVNLEAGARCATRQAKVDVPDDYI